ncbi:MAG: TrkH family potassium uptake protein [Planctomycetes bacterium]|nr:TrkH family potassium uptake protein [Planctomycetota bacterium]
MDIKSVLGILGKLLMLLAFFMVAPIFAGIFVPNPSGANELPEFQILALLSEQFESVDWMSDHRVASDVGSFVLAFLLTFAAGLLLKTLFPVNADSLTPREGFAVVGLGWMFFTAFACVPFWISGVMPNFTDAYFEVMSGFTTTGSTVIDGRHLPHLANAIESLPHGLLFWRSMTHWLGGMGIIVLTLAILPTLGAGGFQIFRAEVTGPSKTDKLTPRVKESAKILWGVYVAMTLLQTVLLCAADREPNIPKRIFDGFCHAFGTVATGGFSTKNASIGFYSDNLLYQWIIIVFMAAAGSSFALWYLFLRGKMSALLANPEWRFYMLIIALFSAVIAYDLYRSWNEAGELAGMEATDQATSDDAQKIEAARKWTTDGYETDNDYDEPFHAATYSTFQVVSIITTTGYVTGDYDQWTALAKFLLVMLMFVGGCAGSTGGGLKVVRVMVLLKLGVREIKRLIHPRAVLRVRLGETVVPEPLIANISAFFVLWMLVIVFSTVALLIMQVPLTESVMAVIACVGNIGPGLGKVGAVGNFAFLPDLAKWVLSLCMLMGRLELYSVLILFMPSTWRK